MGKVWINGEETEVKALQLSEVLSEIRRSALQKGEVITNVRIDGESVAVENDEDFAHFLLTDLEKIEIKTENVKTVTLNGLDTIYKRKKEMEAVAEEIARKFRTGQQAEAQAKLASFLNEIEYLITLLSSYGAFVHFSSKEDQKVLEKAREVLKAMLVSLQQQKYLEAADALEYELLPLQEKIVDRIPYLLANTKHASH